MPKVSRWAIGLAVLLIGLAPAAWAGTIRHDRSDESYLLLADQFESVGRVDFSTPGGGFMGSGTLIAPDWVLTAAHVVDQADFVNYTIGGQTYSAVEWVAHPRWTGNLLAGYDIGLIKLGSEVAGITPAERYTGSDELGAEATLTGYGMTGTGLTGAYVFDGQKRAGENVIDVLYGRNKNKQRLMLCDFDNPLDPADNAFGSSAAMEMELMIAPGDSGGGVFLDSESGPMLAGVNSFLAWNDEAGDSDYGDMSGHTRVSVFNNWIDDVLAGGDEGHGGGRPPWAGPKDRPAAVPEPATLGLLAIAGLCVLRKRRA